MDAIFTRINSILHGDLMTPEVWDNYQLFFGDMVFPEQIKLKNCKNEIRVLVNQTYQLVKEERKRATAKRRDQGNSGTVQDETYGGDSTKQLT